MPRPTQAKSTDPAGRSAPPLWIVLLGVWVLAFGIRCVYLWQIHHAPFFDLRIGDGEGYHAWARRIADGDWVGSGVFYQAPLYPYFLAIIYRLLDDSTNTVRLIQALLGAMSCVLLARVGVSLFGRRGVIAGIALAVYPSAIFQDGLIEKTSLLTLFMTALLALLAGRMTLRRWLATGVILGLLALTRENALILILPVLLWIPGSWRDRLKPAFAFVGACLLVLLPVGVRNLAVGGEFHLTTSQFGPNFYIGNHRGADGTYQALVVGHGSAGDERDDAMRLAEQRSGRKLTPGGVSSYWTKQSLDYITSQPVDWLKLTGRKLALTFSAEEMSDSESQDVYAEWSWVLRILKHFDFGLLLGLAALGVALTGSSWRRLWLYALGATYALSVVLFYVFARYRFPLVPILMLLATGTAVNFRGNRRLVVGAVAALLAFSFARLPLDNAARSRATNYANIARVLAKDPIRPDAAAGFYQRAIDAVSPPLPAAQFGLGTLLVQTGRPQEAIPYYRAAVATWPDYEEAHYNLGLALAQTGLHQEAEQAFGQALQLRPDDAEAHFALAKTLVALNHSDVAAKHYEQGLALQPKNVSALVGWGVALTQSGRVDDALQKYQQALRLDPQDATAHNSLGWTLASQGRIAEAIPHFERALALKPDFENARRNLEQARQMLAQSKRR